MCVCVYIYIYIYMCVCVCSLKIVGIIDKSAQLWELFIDREDLTLNSLHATPVFREEDKRVACPPLSSGI